MKRDYTNKNKRFYDKSQYESKKRLRDKKMKLKIEIFTYIFNNFYAFENMINSLIELEKEYKDVVKNANFDTYLFMKPKEFKIREMYRFNVYGFNENNFFSLYFLANSIYEFFKNLNYSYIDNLNFNKEANEIFKLFLEKGYFDKNVFIEVICKELKDNFYLKRFSKNFEFEILLELALENKNILEIASKENKEEILEIL